MAVGALRTIATESRRIVDAGVPFVVRSVSSLVEKDAARLAEAEQSGRAARPAPVNPFLPCVPALGVAELSPTHLCVLNKYNVLPSHLLVVTQSFVDQDEVLTAADFRAVAVVLAEIDGLAFYNAGAAAGASQPHRHLQVVPLPLSAPGEPDSPPVPIQPLLEQAHARLARDRIPGLPFPHAFTWLDPTMAATPEGAAAAACAQYWSLLDAVGLTPEPGATRPRAAYNLLYTRRWMLLVPRARERAAGISVNALGFAGSLFVRDAAAMAAVQRLGPMTVLRAVALGAAGTPPAPAAADAP